MLIKYNHWLILFIKLFGLILWNKRINYLMQIRLANTLNYGFFKKNQNIF